MSVLYERLTWWAATYPHKPFIVEAETGRELTYGQCLSAVRAMRRFLGDAPRCIYLMLPGGIANAVIWLSALTDGHTLVPLAPDARSEEHARVACIYPADILVAERPIDMAGKDRSKMLVITRQECESLIAGAMLACADSASLESREGQICLMTSGSTGEPKRVVLSERQLSWTASSVVGSHQLSPADRGLAVLPFFHINAPVVSLCATLLAGWAVVIASRFSRGQFWSWVEGYHITWASIVPTILAILLQTTRPSFLPGAVRFVRTASAPLPAFQMLRFEKQFGIPVIETYGLTEAASQVCANPLPPGQHKPGSVGVPVGVALRICQPRSEGDAAALQDVAPGETGEICISGPGVIRRYVGASGTDAFHDGWFRTGDLGYRDADGYVYITGRLRRSH